MSAGKVSRVLSLIPERTARTQSGVVFNLEGTNCIYPERLAHVAKFLGWLSPLAVLTREDQVTLGLVAANGRPVAPSEDEDLEEAELEIAVAEAPIAPMQEAVL